MNNFELHQEAVQLADSHSAYMLAKMLLIEQKERVELAAHVERLREDVYDQANTILGEFGVRETIDDYLPDSYNDTPSTSLARRDSLKQAELLEAEAQGWPADPYTECSHVRKDILEIAAELRQKASQLESN